MIDAELKELVAATHRALTRLAALSEESERRRRGDDDRRREDSDRQWQKMREESDRQWQKMREESDRQWERSRKEMRDEFQEELKASRAEHDRMMRSLNREIGRIHRKFGGYSESLARPAIIKLMRDRFGMSEIAPRVRAYRNGKAIELDVLGHANDRIDQVVLGEIKTTLRQDAIDQILEHLRVFPEFFPRHRGKQLYGVLAAIEAPPEMQEKVLKEGIYLMLVSEETCELREPEGFEPRDFAAA